MSRLNIAFIGFLLNIGFFLVTLVMPPILVLVYARLAKREEKDMVKEFGHAYERYRSAVPAFIPHFPHKAWNSFSPHGFSA